MHLNGVKIREILKTPLKASRARIEAAADPSEMGRLEYKALFDKVKREIKKDPELSKYIWEESELHHLKPIKVGEAADPGGATEPDQYCFCKRQSQNEGTSQQQIALWRGSQTCMENYVAGDKGPILMVGPYQVAILVP